MEKFLKVVEKIDPKKVLGSLNNVVTMYGNDVKEYFSRPCHAWMDNDSTPMHYLADFSLPGYYGKSSTAESIKEWDELLAKVPMCARVLYDEQTDFSKPYVATKTTGKYSKEMFFVLVLRRMSWERPAFTKRAVMFHKEWGISPTNAVMLSTFYQNATGVGQEVATSHIAFNSTAVCKLLRDTLNDVVRPLATRNTLDVSSMYYGGIANSVGKHGDTDVLEERVKQIFSERTKAVELKGTEHMTHEGARAFIGLVKLAKGKPDIKMELKTFITIADEVINGW